MDIAGGYLSSKYAASLAEFGEPQELSSCKGWVLKRSIQKFSDFYDAMGCYPLFSCQNWPQLKTDLDSLNGDIISFTAVTDPFGDYNERILQESFFDVVKPYKAHYVVDLHRPLESYVCSHHRRNVRSAGKQCKIEYCSQPQEFLEDWNALYHQLIIRHQIKGLAAFSRNSFQKQFLVPGLSIFRAVYQQKTVGMLLWYRQNQVAYYHLGAYSLEGYRLKASFALFWSSIEYFRSQGLDWLDLGAGAGLSNNLEDGLNRFKNGWSTGTNDTYLCGRIFDRKMYDIMAMANDVSHVDYFPAYRFGETL